MRLTLLAVLIAVTPPLAGCAKVTKEQGTKAFHKELHLYFNNLNNEAQTRKDEYRRLDPRLGLTPTGSIYSTFVFDETAFVVKNFKCRVCETKLIVTSPTMEYLCPSCGHSPYTKHPDGFNRKESPCKTCIGADGHPKEATTIRAEDFQAAGGTVLPMFEFMPGKDNPNATMAATVRYVRKQWAYDQRGVVDVSQKAIDKAAVDASYLPTAAEGSVGRAPGFHRLDATFVGEIDFEFRGGELTVKTRRAEEAVRPWKNLKGNQ